MGEKTGIPWAHATFNPWWGCTKIREGCTHCYAERESRRFGWDVWGPNKDRRFFDERHWLEPLRWNKKAKANGQPLRVFCGSMCDVLEGRSDLNGELGRLYGLIEATEYLTWLLLTKRPENAPKLLPASWFRGWPQHVWFGFTAENQRQLEIGWSHAVKIPTPVLWVSAEPLLGPLNVEPYLSEETGEWSYRPLRWVVVAGESGGPAVRALVEHVPIETHFGGEVVYGWRPKESALNRVRSLRDQCHAAAAPFFWKGWGGPRPTSGGRLLDGREHNEFPQSG